MKSVLSENQLSALRALDPEDEHSYSKNVRINARTLKSLKRRGLVDLDDDNKQGATITTSGLSYIRGYVSRTGNGPEGLKALFRKSGW